MGKPLNTKLLKDLRKAAGLRQLDLAQLCGISEKAVRLAERGDPVGIDVLTRLAEGLRVEPAEQLFAVPELTLSEVRRLDDEGNAIEPRLAKGKGARQAYQLTRVRMNRPDRRAIRYYLLSLVTPSSGMTLELDWCRF